jgi:hypothetical protein
MPPNLPAGRILLLVVAASYLLSAGLLAAARLRGVRMEHWVIAGWLLTGLAGATLAAALQPGRPVVWVGLLVALGPWMLYSLAYDVREGVWVMVAADVAGLAAIALGLTFSREALAGG